MSRKINTKNKGKWITFPGDEEIKFLVKPFPYTLAIVENMVDGLNQNELQKKMAMLMLDVCVEDWQGIVDENDKPLKCNPTNKAKVLHYDYELATFILTNLDSINNKQEEEVKN